MLCKNPLLISLICILATYPSSAISCFQPPLNTGLDPNSGRAEVADVNRDGKLDLLIPEGLSESLSVYLGNGDGTFQSPVSYPTTQIPVGPVVGDLNRDGKTDIVLSTADFNEQITGVDVFLGNGDGTFQPAVFYSTLPEPGHPVIADFNHDGNLDVGVANPGSPPNFSILFGNGDGTLNTPVTVPLTPLTVPIYVVAGDFNKDGKVDLAVSEIPPSGADVSILLGNGDGTFQDPRPFPLGGSSPGEIRVSDLNKDGNLDLVAVTPLGEDGNDGLSVLLGRGDGTFRGPEILTGANGFQPTTVAVADITGDGKLDLVEASEAPGYLTLFRGAGNGTFPKKVSFADQLELVSARAGDFNGDGRIDIAAVGFVPFTSVTLQIFLNSGRCH
jgi:FG-GAP-like repeat